MLEADSDMSDDMRLLVVADGLLDPLSSEGKKAEAKGADADKDPPAGLEDLNAPEAATTRVSFSSSLPSPWLLRERLDSRPFPSLDAARLMLTTGPQGDET